MSTKDPLYIKVTHISECLGKVIESIEQPMLETITGFHQGFETIASRRWWNLAKLRHVLTDIDFYIRKRDMI